MGKQIITIVDREFELDVDTSSQIDGLTGYPQFINEGENDADYGVRYASKEIQQCELDIVKATADLHSTDGILEIGVARNKNGLDCFTYQYLNAKPNDVPYVAIDIDDKSFLNDDSKKIYSIQSKSEEQDKIREFLKEKGIDKISILSIDGWHSINAVINDWKYTDLLVPGGVVIFHDSNYHPGVHCFIPFIDQTKYKVTKYFEGEDAHGITIAEKL